MSQDEDIVARTPRGEVIITLRLTIPREQPDTPHVRFAVLPLGATGTGVSYAIYDRVLARIVDGVYCERRLALEVAAHCNARGSAPHDMTPNAAALGLLFPRPVRQEDHQ